MTQLFSDDLELRWRAWQARGVEDSRLRDIRMGTLVLVVAGALSMVLLFQVL